MWRIHHHWSSYRFPIWNKWECIVEKTIDETRFDTITCFSIKVASTHPRYNNHDEISKYQNDKLNANSLHTLLTRAQCKCWKRHFRSVIGTNCSCKLRVSSAIANCNISPTIVEPIECDITKTREGCRSLTIVQQELFYKCNNNCR